MRGGVGWVGEWKGGVKRMDRGGAFKAREACINFTSTRQQRAS